MLLSMPTRYFRAGIGTVIINNQQKVAFFERKKEPAGIWQFQQGGIDVGETPEDTLWRELLEEVGLTKNEVDVIGKLPEWYTYVDLDAATDASIVRYGQAHQWFFLKLRESVSIDLRRALDDEFKDWRWVTFEEAIERTSTHKQHVYKRLYQFYCEHF